MQRQIIFLLAFFTFHLATQGKDVSKIDSVKTKEHSGFLILPFLLKSPETNVGFGFAAAYFFKTTKTDSTVRTSDVDLLSLYTLKEQLVVVLGSVVYFKKEKKIFRWQSSYSYYPDKFWGIGNNTPSSNEEEYSIKQFYFNPQILFKIYHKLYFGVSAEFQTTKDFIYKSGGIFDKDQVAGRFGGATSGIGILETYDSRNNAFFPTKGGFVEINTTIFSKSIGGDFNFSTNSIELKKFYAINENAVLALHGFGKFNVGDVPIRNLAMIGGSEMMRGFYKGRFSDKDILTAQTEWRQHIYNRFGITVFASAGEVSPETSRFSFDKVHFAYGAGLRFMVEKKEKLNLRLDYGRGEGENGLYIILKEAF